MTVSTRKPTDGSTPQPLRGPPTMSRERPGSGPPAAFTLRAPAKVNLFLEVTARRPDGYHDLRTLMVAVSLFDALAFAPAATVWLHVLRPDARNGTGEPGGASGRVAPPADRHDRRCSGRR